MPIKRRPIVPILVLFFLSPAVGELLSGSAPPVEFFNPFTLLLLGALYGSGALLVRELRVRWNKGWPTVLALGAAYGIVEEGLMVKSFFDPGWVDIGILGSYGRWGGVNWIWSMHLTAFHAVFSIAVPILLVELLLPAWRDERWLGRGGLIGFGLLLLADVVFGFLALTTYRPPWGPYVGAVVLAGALVYLARRLPRRLCESPGALVKSPPPRPLLFSLAGFGLTLALFVVFWLLPEINVPVGVTAAAGLGVVLLAAWGGPAMSRGGTWLEQHRLALAAGGLGFFVLLAPLQELDTTRTDNPAGMTLVALAAVVLLALLWRRVRLWGAGPPVPPC